METLFALIILITFFVVIFLIKKNIDIIKIILSYFKDEILNLFRKKL